MTYVIAEPCRVKDRSCVDVCPVDCIYEGEDQLYIHPDEVTVDAPAIAGYLAPKAEAARA